MDRNKLTAYAEFVVNSAVNIQKGQAFIINAPVEAAEFARLCAQAAYQSGAREVIVHYQDEILTRLKMEHAGADVLEDIKPWLLQRYMEYREGGVSTLRIHAEDPELLKGLDSQKISLYSRAVSQRMHPWLDLNMANHVQWCVIGIPCRSWACRVFPDLDETTAVEKLWETIFQVCRIGGDNPAAIWSSHTAALADRCEKLNRLTLMALHLSSSNGTDLTIGLPKDHIWSGGQDYSAEGIPFIPNVPTEEVFTAPHRDRVEGVVKSSLPFVCDGVLIEGISVRFEKGVAVEYSAEKGDAVFREMLESDEGAKRLGEIALVPAGSPIRASGVLFYNTLFDENAACHIAFGASYPDTIKDGKSMSVKERLSLGMNDSLIHEDIMIGTDDMDIDGIKENGDRIAVFRKGNWVLNKELCDG